MRFLVDEDLPRSLAVALQTAGHQARAMVDTSWRGCTDARVLAIARAAGESVVTRDVGLASVATRGGRNAPSVVLARFPSELPLPRLVIDIVAGILRAGEIPPRGQTVVVAPGVVRTRARR